MAVKTLPDRLRAIMAQPARRNKSL